MTPPAPCTLTLKPPWPDAGDLALLYRYRWFKLTPNALVYYKRASDAIPGEDPRGVIEFTPGMTVELVPYVGSWIMAGLAACLESGTLYDCCFGSKTTLVITTQNRRLRLECPSQEAAVQWHEAFLEVVYGRELVADHQKYADGANHELFHGDVLFRASTGHAGATPPPASPASAASLPRMMLTPRHPTSQRRGRRGVWAHGGRCGAGRSGKHPYLAPR